MTKTILLGGLLLLGGCDVFGVDTHKNTKSDLRDERAKWVALGVHNYSYEFTKVCACTQLGTVVVTVTNDAITSVVVKDTGQPVTQQQLTTYTIPQFYDYLLTVVDQADSFAIDYDHTTHVPSQVLIDFSVATSGDQVGMGLGNFTAL